MAEIETKSFGSQNFDGHGIETLLKTAQLLCLLYENTLTHKPVDLSWQHQVCHAILLDCQPFVDPYLCKMRGVACGLHSIAWLQPA